MLSTYLIIRRLGIANLRLDQAIILFHNFSNLRFIMSKRFESGASKRKRKKFENDMVTKIKPITAFLHQPLTEATGAGSEVGALTLAQENQCDDAKPNHCSQTNRRRACNNTRFAVVFEIRQSVCSRNK